MSFLVLQRMRRLCCHAVSEPALRRRRRGRGENSREGSQGHCRGRVAEDRRLAVRDLPLTMVQRELDPVVVSDLRHRKLVEHLRLSAASTHVAQLDTTDPDLVERLAQLATHRSSEGAQVSSADRLRNRPARRTSAFRTLEASHRFGATGQERLRPGNRRGPEAGRRLRRRWERRRLRGQIKGISVAALPHACAHQPTLATKRRSMDGCPPAYSTYATRVPSGDHGTS